MRITYQGEDFDLPRNFSTTLNRYNVMLSDTGDQTKTFTLPGSPKNLRLAGWSDRIDAVYKPLQDISVLVTDGLMCKICTLSFNAPPSEEDGLNCTLYMGEGEFYNLIGDDKIASIQWPVIKSPDYETETLEQHVQYLINLIKSEYLNPNTKNYFKVGILKTNKTIKEKVNGTVVEIPLVLNDFASNQLFNIYNVSGTISTFRGESNHVYMENDIELSTTTGYGMTVFLKVKYVLEHIFDFYGYTLNIDENDTPGNNQFLNNCIENNVADAIYAGVLLYRQLLPDITIKDFIQKIETYYAGKFVIDNINKIISFVKYNRFFYYDADMDLTPYMSDKIKLQNTEFTDILIKSSNSVKNEETGKKNKVTNIDLNLKESANYIQIHTLVENGSYETINVGFTAVECNGILELNSQINIDGKISESDKNTASVFSIINIKKTYVTLYHNLGGSFKLYYTSARPYLYTGNPGPYVTDEEWLNGVLYPEYIEFHKNSNIPFTVQMNIPETVLNKLNLQTPKIIQGQRVLIESIEQPTGTARELREKQTVTFRTLRPYQDRV